MTTSPHLTEAEYEWLHAIMERFDAPRAMNIEALDGFFAALVCAPHLINVYEYLPELWGGEMTAEKIFSDDQEAQKFMRLIKGHWKHVVHSLETSDIFLPLFIENEEGKICGNDWAMGFLRGMELSRLGWETLLESEEDSGVLVPIFVLAYEHHDDPTLRSHEELSNPKKREAFIAQLIISVPLIYQYFAPHRLKAMRSPDAANKDHSLSLETKTYVQCCCGSGKKYEDCCGKVTVH